MCLTEFKNPPFYYFVVCCGHYELKFNRLKGYFHIHIFGGREGSHISKAQ